MELDTDWVGNIIAIGGMLGTLVTAVATIFLWRVTKLLAKETTRMAEASAQPHVVATLDPNRWSMIHFDLNVDNTGNAAAYDIQVDFDPPLENGEARGEEMPSPLNKISVLKPGHGISSYLSEYKPLKGKVYTVTVSWLRYPTDKTREATTYELNMNYVAGLADLGGDPIIKAANSIEKINKDIHHLATGFSHLKVDTFSSGDRLHEKRIRQREHRQWRRELEERNKSRDD